MDHEKQSEIKTSTTFKDSSAISVHSSDNNQYPSELSPKSSILDSNDTSPATHSRNRIQRFVDSFKPIQVEDDGIDTSKLTPIEKSNLASSRQPLGRQLKSRHLQMIAIGGSIGTGLFVGSGYALSQGGPGSLLLGYFVVGASLLVVVLNLGELCVQFKNRNFNDFHSRLLDPSIAYTLTIMYSVSWIISYPSELIAAAMTIQFWNDSINPALWVAIIWIVITLINLFNVRIYGESELILSIIKVLAVIGFIILGICIICGVGDQGYIGTKYWHPIVANDFSGSFISFKSLASVFITCAFGFGGIELAALASSEAANPRKSLPKATKGVFWRILIFYVLTAVIIGCLVPYSNSDLLDGEGIAASPFVIAVNSAGINVVPHIMNAVIVIAVVSVGSSSVYGASRTLASLAAQGLIWDFFGYIDRQGRPIVSIILTSLIGLLGFLVVNKNEGEVFTWFFSVCSLASFFIWSFICVAHIRWRWALHAQGRSSDEIIFKSPFGTIGSWIALAVLLFIIAVIIWVGIMPLGEDGPDVVTFWQNCLSLPLLIVIWAAHKTYYKTWNQFWIKLKDIDLDTGRREVDLDLLKQELLEEKEALAQRPIWYRIYRFLC
ncbi:SAM3 [Candida pseudojiufengensis]|uniref:SAM3 n=1 Tax=Candida pseudojiufengensis TaxID=497109 RepID=UPI0022257C7A|nr:SAM3 [Candida pseudojiufengensis]KAI5964737.1 SAM3 [Candida pseudojiufengensis]